MGGSKELGADNSICPFQIKIYMALLTYICVH